jgi:hypothetical protein
MRGAGAHWQASESPGILYTWTGPDDQVKSYVPVTVCQCTCTDGRTVTVTRTVTPAPAIPSPPGRAALASDLPPSPPAPGPGARRRPGRLSEDADGGPGARPARASDSGSESGCQCPLQAGKLSWPARGRPAAAEILKAAVHSDSEQASSLSHAAAPSHWAASRLSTDDAAA